MTPDEIDAAVCAARLAAPAPRECDCANAGVWGEVDADGFPSIRFCAHRKCVDECDGCRRD